MSDVAEGVDCARLLLEYLTQVSRDRMLEMLTTLINALVPTEADAVCGVGYNDSATSAPLPQRLPMASGCPNR